MKITGISLWECRYLLLNNTGITLKPKFYFIILKFVTRGVCGYLDGPCCLLTTTGAAQRNAQSTVQPQHPSPQNPKNFKVDFRKKYGSYGALDRPKFLRKLCSFVRSYLRPWGPKTLGSEKSLNSPYPYSSSNPGVFYTCSYNHAHRPRLGKLL